MRTCSLVAEAKTPPPAPRPAPAPDLNRSQEKTRRYPNHADGPPPPIERLLSARVLPAGGGAAGPVHHHRLSPSTTARNHCTSSALLFHAAPLSATLVWLAAAHCTTTSSSSAAAPAYAFHGAATANTPKCGIVVLAAARPLRDPSQRVHGGVQPQGRHSSCSSRSFAYHARRVTMCIRGNGAP